MKIAEQNDNSKRSCDGLPARGAAPLATKKTGELSVLQKAYALLWRDGRLSDKPFVSQARLELLRALSTAEQAAAIAWVSAKYPISESEVSKP
jgi:hypothetical protein